MRTRAIKLPILVVALTTISALALSRQTPVAQAELTDGQIKSILRERIEVAKKSFGIVVGLIDEKGAHIVSYGKPSQDSTQT